MPAHNNLSPQFGNVAPQLASDMERGGFSYHAPDLNEGVLVSADDRHPEGGYMVAIPGAEKSFPPTQSKRSAEFHVKQFLGDHVTHEPEQYYGGWSEPSGAATYDISAHHATLGEAKAAGKPAGERAAFQLKAPVDTTGEVRLHMEGFGRNDTDPHYRSTGNSNVAEGAELTDRRNRSQTGKLKGKKHTLDEVYDTINNGRAEKVRAKVQGG